MISVLFKNNSETQDLKSLKLKILRWVRFFPFYGISILPFKILYIFSDLTFIVVFYIIRYRRRVVYNNIEKSFPKKSKKEIRMITINFYRHFCDLIFESIKRLTINKKDIKERLEIKNPEVIENFKKRKKNVILYTAHFGNWEWLVFMPSLIELKSYTLYKPIKNSYFNELIGLMRGRFPIEFIPLRKGYRRITQIEANNDFSMFCFIADQSPKLKSAKQWVNFLGRDTAFYLGPQEIALKKSYAVVYPNFTKTRRGHYKLEFQIIQDEDTSENNESIVEKFAKHLEKSIYKFPEMWLWTHRRWKLSKA